MKGTRCNGTQQVIANKNGMLTGTSVTTGGVRITGLRQLWIIETHRDFRDDKVTRNGQSAEEVRFSVIALQEKYMWKETEQGMEYIPKRPC